jgi:hypothetical protein
MNGSQAVACGDGASALSRDRCAAKNGDPARAVEGQFARQARRGSTTCPDARALRELRRRA